MMCEFKEVPESLRPAVSYFVKDGYKKAVALFWGRIKLDVCECLWAIQVLTLNVLHPAKPHSPR